MIIDCDTCEVRDKACGDCVVSFLTIPVRAGASASHDTHGVRMDADQEAAVEALVAGGLVPPLRLVHSAEPRTGAPLVTHTGRHAS
ncbi:hypothetical protein [Demequina oxidasica]|uniref:hypothetical protein n=1 Tax=Demequina oxidasica TaxID=676199 RepID=UPI000A06B0B4|nr:hypothetical protein [Demequina oxidasica]